MAQKKHKPDEILAKLRQVDVLVSQGGQHRSTQRKSQSAATVYGR